MTTRVDDVGSGRRGTTSRREERSMEITGTVTEGHETFRLEGELDLNNAMDVKVLLDDEVKKAPKSLILDMGGLTYVDSTGIGILINAMKTLKALNGTLVLLSLPPSILAIFSKTNLLKFFVLAPDPPSLKKVLGES
jgi:anti-sigma B factor antagonist